MPIHDQSYRRYAGERSALGRSWLVIASAGIKSMIRKRPLLGLLLLGWMQFIGRAVTFWFASNVPQTAQVLAPSAETFRDFLDKQGFFVFVFTVYVGAGLIANDRRANALQVYLSKPLTRAEYVAGKFAILFVFLVGVTWLPAILLLLIQVLFAGSLAFVRDNFFLLPAITLFSLLQVLVSAMTMLALSSMSKSSRFVGIMYAGLIFFTAAMFQALRGITRNSTWAFLSPTDTLEQIGAVIFRADPPYDLSPTFAVVTLIVLIAGSAWILERRVRGVEVVQ
jgi:ABC-2 type transport system permease protein